MSDQVKSFIDAVGVKMRGNTMRCQAQYLRLLHIPAPEDLWQSDIDALRQAFLHRDRRAATECFDEIMSRREKNDERGAKASPVEVV